jgi:hypothetical protein
MDGSLGTTLSRDCSSCRLTKPLGPEHFHRRPGGFSARCKECVAAKRRECAAERSIRRKILYHNRRADPSRRARDAEIAARWRERHPDRSNASQRAADAKRRVDPLYCLHKRMRGAIRKALLGRKGGRSWEVIVGYSREQLSRHIERLFTRGMTWQKFRDGAIHIDHRRPIVSFPATEQGFLECWSITNLQPLWAPDNLSKHDKRLLLL